jgi:hypothetical protein
VNTNGDYFVSFVIPALGIVSFLSFISYPKRAGALAPYPYERNESNERTQPIGAP